MSVYTRGTFSLSGKQKVGGGMVVFSRVLHRYQGGGSIDISGTNPLTTKKYAVGDIIPAGTMVKFVSAGKPVTILPNTLDEGGLAGVNGLIEYDVVVPEGAVSVTCAVVKAGRVYADRVVQGSNRGLPDAAEKLLPLFEFVREN